MAALPAYSCLSLPLVVLGLWHFVCCCRAYLKSPDNFCARSWHPCCLRLRHLELYIELSALLIAIAYQSISLSSLAHASFTHIIALQQLVLLLIFALSLFIILISEASGVLPFPSDFQFVLLGLSFCAECMVLKSFLDPSLVLEKECFDLQSLLAAVCAISCFLLAWRPKAFVVNVVLSVCISLQGSWLLQVGLSLFTEFALPQGCHRLSNGSTQCDFDLVKTRAVAVMDLTFLLHIIGSVFFFVIVYALVARTVGWRRNGGMYDCLDTNGEPDHLQMRPLSSKVVID